MKTLIRLIGIFLLLPLSGLAQDLPPTNNPTVPLNTWQFTDTNWLSRAGYSPVAFTNIVNVTNSGDGNALLVDTGDTSPGFLLYNVAETNGYTNIDCATGSISLWFNPDWSSTNAGGTGPGNWADIISLGQWGTNGSSWWAWYMSPDGGTVYFSAQTNDSPWTNYLSAPVSLTASTWYNFVLTYSSTNTAFYTNGVLVTSGTGVTYWPGSEAPFFAIGSDTNGYHQAEGRFDDLATYNYPLAPLFISEMFGMYSIFYGYATYSASPQNLVPAPSTNSIIPIFDAVTGPGFLTGTASGSSYGISSNVWLTNWSATLANSNVMNVDFAIGGGSNNVPYDVFATLALSNSITNAVWYWMGQAYRGTNYTLPLTNYPPGNVFLILGTPQDSDQDGLTDAYERLVSHTNPYNPDSNGSGMLDGWAIVFGLNPLVDASTQTAMRSNFTYDPVGRLDLLTGIRSETLTNDFEGNILLSH